MKKSIKNITFSDDHIIHKLPQMLGCSKDDILFIDIETTGLSPRNSEIYMIGLSYCENDSWRIVQLFAEGPAEEGHILKMFAKNFSGHSKVINFNGDRFDLPFLKSKKYYYYFSEI